MEEDVIDSVKKMIRDPRRTVPSGSIKCGREMR